MNNKIVYILVLMVLVAFGLTAWYDYRSASIRINNQAASIYDATDEPFDQRVLYSDAITWQMVGNNQCIGLNEKGQASIGTVYRKSFSFSRGCKVSNQDLSIFIGSNIQNTKRFWFGSLVGSQCYAVTVDSSGNATQVFLEQDIKDKGACLIN